MALPYLLAAIGVPAVELLHASTSSPTTLIESFHDDAFYYFEIARNVAEGNGSTFDTIDSTNGYHPLWMALLVPVFELESDIYRALVLVQGVTAVIWFLAIVWTFRIARLLDGAVWFSPALVPLVYQRYLWFRGMETGLLLTVFLVVVWKALSRSAFTANRLRPFGLGCWLAWVPMARLDAVFFVAAFALTLFLKDGSPPRQRARTTALLLAPSALLVGLYMATSLVWFGTATPVSGQAKSLGAPFLNFGMLGDYLRIKPLPAPGLELLNTLGLLALIVAPAWLYLVFGPRWRRLPGLTLQSTLGPVLTIMLLAQGGQLLYYSLASSWPLWNWYYYYTPVLLLFSVPVWVQLGLRLLRPSHNAALVLPGLVALVLGIHLQRSFDYNRSLPVQPEKDYKTASVLVATSLNRATRPGSVFAMADRAGSLAYQLDRPLVQTEGLVNSVEFLAALEEGTVHDFLQQRDVEYIIYSGGEHSGAEPEPAPSGDDCSFIVEPKFGRGPKFTTIVCDEDLVLEIALEQAGAMGGGYWVWRYRPELNPP